VLLKVPYGSLAYWQKELGEFSVFREPDIGNEVTAIAAFASGEPFQGLPLV